MRRHISKSDNNSAELSPFQNSSFLNPHSPFAPIIESDAISEPQNSASSTSPQFAPYQSNQELSTSLPPDSAWNELTQMIYSFQCDHRLSRKAINDLLKLMEAARNYPDERLDMDWRTALRHKMKHELEILKA
jgi:hypothetical protein